MAGRRRKRAYRPLLKLTHKVLARAHATAPGGSVMAWWPGILPSDRMSSSLGLDQQLGHYVALTAQVLEQTRRRVVLGESVPNAEKVFSIFQATYGTDQSRQDAAAD